MYIAIEEVGGIPFFILEPVLIKSVHYCNYNIHVIIPMCSSGVRPHS